MLLVLLKTTKLKNKALYQLVHIEIPFKKYVGYKIEVFSWSLVVNKYVSLEKIKKKKKSMLSYTVTIIYTSVRHLE